MTWLRRTHQVWKLTLLTWAMGLSLVLGVLYRLEKERNLLVFGASAAALLVMFVGFWAIRCPLCGARVGWRVVSRTKAREVWTTLRDLEVCPVCADDPTGTNRDPPPAPFSAWRS